MNGNVKPLKHRFTQRQRNIFLAVVGILLAIFATLCLLIPVFAKQAIRSKIAHIEQEKQLSIDINQLKIKHFSIFGNFDIQINGLSVQDKKSTDAFFQANGLRTKVQVWKGFRRTLIVKTMEADTLQIHAIKNEHYCNYKFLSNKKSSSSPSKDYQKVLTGLLQKFENYCPNNLSVNQFVINTFIDSAQIEYLFNDLKIHHGKGSGVVQIKQAAVAPESWNLVASFDNKRHLYEGSIIRQGGEHTLGSLPFLKYFELMDVQIHEATGKFTWAVAGKRRVDCNLSGKVCDLQCQHHYLAEVPVRIDHLGANLLLHVGSKSVVVDSTSTITLNQATFHPSIRYTNDKSKHIVLKINENERDAEPIFASLPHDLFQVIPNMRFSGKMGFNCLLNCDFGHIDSLKFDFNLINIDRILHITEGLGEITHFNEEFEYTFYDHGEAIRALTIGPSNPYFCPSQTIPEILKQAILASEDGAFFVHNGFCKSAMQQALIDDIKAGKMRRGGSTITMQLIKNLFLNRKKVLTRKFEEMLLVWLIEDQHLISKERMFEIYVNIIEWAPGVIGIGEASEFYFHKRPHELTMPECIYLATLIRAPKHYASTLNADGSVTDVKREELEFVADRMVIREFMTEAQRSVFDANVKTVIRRNDN